MPWVSFCVILLNHIFISQGFIWQEGDWQKRLGLGVPLFASQSTLLLAIGSPVSYIICFQLGSTSGTWVCVGGGSVNSHSCFNVTTVPFTGLHYIHFPFQHAQHVCMMKRLEIWVHTPWILLCTHHQHFCKIIKAVELSVVGTNCWYREESHVTMFQSLYKLVSIYI